MSSLAFVAIKRAHEIHGLTSMERVEALVFLLANQGSTLAQPLHLDVRREVGDEINRLVYDIFLDA